MRASMETYHNVAENCSAFSSASEDETFKSMYSEGDDVSCTTCEHFTEDSYCDLDLYDQIVENHDIG